MGAFMNFLGGVLTKIKFYKVLVTLNFFFQIFFYQIHLLHVLILDILDINRVISVKKFFMNDYFTKSDQISSLPRIWSYLL